MLNRLRVFGLRIVDEIEMDFHTKFPSVKDRKITILRGFDSLKAWQSDVSTTFAAYGVEHWLTHEVFEVDLSPQKQVLYVQSKQFMRNTIDSRHKVVYEKEKCSAESLYGVTPGTTPSPAEMWDNVNKLFYPNARKAN